MKLIYALSLLLVLLSCKKQDPSLANTASEDMVSTTVTESDISKIDYTEFVLSQEARKMVDPWAEYHQLQEQVSYIKKGDLSYFNDNDKAIETLLKDLIKNIPEDLKNNPILARIKIVETTTYKLESLLRLSTTTKPELVEGIKAFLVAISNLDLQLNKIIELKRNENIPKP